MKLLEDSNTRKTMARIDMFLNDFIVSQIYEFKTKWIYILKSTFYIIILSMLMH